MNNYTQQSVVINKRPLRGDEFVFRKLLAPQSPRYNTVHPPKPINLLLHRKQMYANGILNGMPRLISPRYKLRHILFKAQSYKSLFNKLPTVFEEESESHSNNAVKKNPKSMRIKRFKPSSYYSSYAETKTEIDYDSYLYTDSYSTSNKSEEASKPPAAPKRSMSVGNFLNRASTTNLNVHASGKHSPEGQEVPIYVEKNKENFVMVGLPMSGHSQLNKLNLNNSSFIYKRVNSAQPPKPPGLLKIHSSNNLNPPNTHNSKISEFDCSTERCSASPKVRVINRSGERSLPPKPVKSISSSPYRAANQSGQEKNPPMSSTSKHRTPSPPPRHDSKQIPVRYGSNLPPSGSSRLIMPEDLREIKKIKSTSKQEAKTYEETYSGKGNKAANKEYKVEDYLYKPTSSELNRKSSGQYTKSQHNDKWIRIEHELFGKDLPVKREPEAIAKSKSKSSVEFSSKATRKPPTADDKLLDIIRDLKLTLESYLVNQNSSAALLDLLKPDAASNLPKSMSFSTNEHSNELNLLKKISLSSHKSKQPSGTYANKLDLNTVKLKNVHIV